MANQTLAVFMLWTATAYLVKNRKGLTYHHDDSGGVHDGCLHDLHLCGEDRPWAA